MDSTAILLRTTRGDFWHHDAELTRFDDTELESLAQKARNATKSLEAELQKRHSTTPNTPLDLINNCDTRLQTCLQHIKVHGRLDKRAANCVELAVRILTAEQTGRRENDYRDFLNDILRQCGPGLSLLCAASFDEFHIAGMNRQTRTSLVNYVKSKRASFSCPEVDNMAIQYGLPLDIGTSSGGMLQDQSPLTAQFQTEEPRTPQASMEQTAAPKFIFSKAPTTEIPPLREPLFSAVQKLKLVMLESRKEFEW